MQDRVRFQLGVQDGGVGGDDDSALFLAQECTQVLAHLLRVGIHRSHYFDGVFAEGEPGCGHAYGAEAH